MPFDFKKYDAKCATLQPDALQREWEHYTRLISGAATSTAVSGIAVPFTMGVSTIGIGLAAPAIHNARKKREIIERHLQRHGATHHTRKRDVITAGAISGTIGVVTLGLAPVGADAITSSAVEHGFTHIAQNELAVKAATHLALDAAAVAVEETHMHSKKEQEAWKAYTLAVKEGKNPPLPTAEVKLPTTTVTQVMPEKAQYQNNFAHAAPEINIVPPSAQHPVADLNTMYFPPPPGQVDLKVNHAVNRRHSVSTLSMNAQPSPDQHIQSQPDGRIIYGTTTAITNPMVAGQSYGIQLAGPPPDPLSRPVSVMGVVNVPTGSVNHPTASTSTSTPQQVLDFPPPPPSPFPQADHATPQQFQPTPQRPRAYSTTSYGTLPSYESHQQTQLLYGSSQLPLSPPPPPPFSPMSGYSPSTISEKTTQDYFTSVAPNSISSVAPYQPQQWHGTSSGQPQTCNQQYNPGDYVKPQSQPQPQPQPCNYNYSVVQSAYVPQDVKHPLPEQQSYQTYDNQHQPQTPQTLTQPQPQPHNYTYSVTQSAYVPQDVKYPIPDPQTQPTYNNDNQYQYQYQPQPQHQPSTTPAMGQLTTSMSAMTVAPSYPTATVPQQYHAYPPEKRAAESAMYFPPPPSSVTR